MKLQIYTWYKIIILQTANFINIIKILSNLKRKCNECPTPLLVNIVIFGLSLSGFPSKFKTRLLGRGFHAFIKKVSFSSPANVGISQSTSLRGPASLLALVSLSNRCGTPQFTPLKGPTSLLAHCLVSIPLWDSTSSLARCPVSGFDTICNDPSPPLVDIILFKLSLPSFPSRF